MFVFVFGGGEVVVIVKPSQANLVKMTTADFVKTATAEKRQRPKNGNGRKTATAEKRSAVLKTFVFAFVYLKKSCKMAIIVVVVEPSQLVRVRDRVQSLSW